MLTAKCADVDPVDPSPRKLRFLQQVAPKVGDDAAEYAWRFELLKLPRIPIIACLVLAIAFQSMVPIIVMVVIGVPTIVAYQLNFSRMNAASRTLGVPISWKSGPPHRADAYEAWCVQQGIRPYSATTEFGCEESVGQ